MPSPFIGEIRLFAGSFAPQQWAFCNGALLPISENEVLFTLIGTTYGGDGMQTFALPDLRSRVPVHQGNLTGTNYSIGQYGGLENVSLTAGHMPSHNHPLSGTSSGQQVGPLNAFPATTASTQTGTVLYGKGTGAPTTLMPQSVTQSPGGLPHNNLQPYLCISFIIALYGIYPSPS